MLVHIGAGYLVREEDIVGYFDIDGKVDSAITKEFLQRAEKKGQCDTAGTDLPRSFVLTSPVKRRTGRGTMRNTPGKIVRRKSGTKAENSTQVYQRLPIEESTNKTRVLDIPLRGERIVNTAGRVNGKKPAEKVIFTHISTQALKKR